MSLWIKICGNTSLKDARLAVDAGADAVGFVFAPSPRRVSAAEVAAIVPHLPALVEKIGVFVDASLSEIYSTVRECGLTGVQLHDDTDPEAPAKLRARLGPELRILRVVHFEAGAPDRTAEHIGLLAQDRHLDAVLVDSRTATAVGGTGVPFDWVAARRTVFGDGARLKLVVAGGLNPENVAQAVGLLQPWGVDVASGVEAAPGRKEPNKVGAFVARARASAPK
jgi:phosphoribosylanthranilate isomerase